MNLIPHWLVEQAIAMAHGGVPWNVALAYAFAVATVLVAIIKE
jgi:hypothetical protein